MAEEIGLSPQAFDSAEFAKVFSGNAALPGFEGYVLAEFEHFNKIHNLRSFSCSAFLASAQQVYLADDPNAPRRWTCDEAQVSLTVLW